MACNVVLKQETKEATIPLRGSSVQRSTEQHGRLQRQGSGHLQRSRRNVHPGQGRGSSELDFADRHRFMELHLPQPR